MRVLFLLIGLMFLNLAQSQTAKLFYSINTSSGLSGSSVTDIVQDTTGFIWIGTKNGLNRYDGNTFLHFNTENSTLKSNDISALFLTPIGQLWIGTIGGGLYTYDPYHQKINAYQQSNVMGERILQIFQNEGGYLWVVSGKGLFKVPIAGGNLEVSKILDESQSVSRIAIGNDGYWVGTGKGTILKYDLEFNFLQEFAIEEKKTSRNTIYAIQVIASDSILVGTEYDGLLVFNPKKSSFSKTTIKETIIRDLYIDSDETLWVATDGSGLFSATELNKFTQHRHISGSETSIASNAIYKIFEDAGSNIWVGTAWNGISIIDRETKDFDYYYSDFLGQEATGVLSIYADESRLLFGSDGHGLYQSSTLENYELPRNTYVQMIKKMDDGYDWVGTFTNGLYRIKGNQIRNYSASNRPNSLSHNDVRSAIDIGNSEFLIGTWGGGVNLLNTKTSTFEKVKWTDNNTLAPVNVVTMKEVSEQIWIGTFGEGLFVYDKALKTIQSVPTEIKNIISLEWKNDRLWVGTWGKGLFQYEISSGNLMPIVTGGLSSNETIVSMLPSKNDGLWLATKTGVFHLTDDNQAQRISQLNGEYHINSCTYDASGIYYFGSTKGVVSFTDEILQGVLDNRKVQILDVSLFNKSISPSSELWTSNGLLLDHDQNTLSFEFAALEFPTSSQINYQIMLEPINNDWIDMGTQRSTTFANLRDGQYHLQIRTSSNSAELASMKFIILKPWWRRWWAFGIFLSMFALLLYLFQRYTANWEKLRANLRIEKLTREKEAEIGKIKQKFFINISHEIRTPLTLITGELEQLAAKTRGDKVVTNALKKLSFNTHHMTHLVNELLDFRKLESEGLKLNVAEGNMVKFVQEIFLSFQNQATSREVDFSFNASNDLIKVWFDRDQSEKVIYNLLSNAFKFTKAGGAIKVKLEEDDQHVFISIEDTGAGIPKEQLEKVFERFYQSSNTQSITGFGIGLSIVRDIVALHGGEIGLESEEGKGSIFSVKYLKGFAHFKPESILSNFNDSETLDQYVTLDSEEADDDPVQIEEDSLLLIVEDNEGIRKFIAQAIGDQFRLAQATNGIEALELIARELPDLIITDVMMPEMDGISLLTKLKSERNTSHIPVIVLTARTGLIYKKEGYDLGADDYITKPFNTILLKSRIRNLLKNQQRLKSKIRNEYLINPKELSINSPDEQFLTDLTRIVDQHVNDENLGAEFISRELGMSHSVVYKKLKALTGFKIVEFIRDYRLTQASKLLKDFGFSVAEACYKVGFTDRKYFSQVFKKKFGMTPTDYAKSDN